MCIPSSPVAGRHIPRMHTCTHAKRPLAGICMHSHGASQNSQHTLTTRVQGAGRCGRAVRMTSLAGALGRVARATLGGTPVVQAGHPALRQVAAQVGAEELKSEPVQTLIKKMIKQVQHRTKGGYGLAASQLGVPKRIFVAQITQRDLAQLGAEEKQELGMEEFPLRVFVNPTMRVTDKRMVATHEGCLSVDGYAAVVRRAHGVRVTALDEQGRQHITDAKGFLARVLQHEMDHLDGHLYIERMDPATFTTTEHLKA